MKGKDVKTIVHLHLEAYIKDETDYSVESLGSLDEVSFKLLALNQIQEYKW